MAKIEEMTKEEVRDMLVLRAGGLLQERRLDAKYEDVFCGTNSVNEIHIYLPETLQMIAEKMEAEVQVEDRNDEDYPYEVSCKVMLFGQAWKLYALKKGEKV